MAVIYKIENLINNKIYIGSTINFKQRLKHHKYQLKNNIHHSRYLQNAWNKYGDENFKIEILEECVEEDILTKEQYYIDNLNSSYNILPLAYRTKGVKRSLETRLKMRNSQLGKKFSKETIDKMRKSKTGVEHPDNSKRIKSVYQIDLKTNQIMNKFKSILQASKITNIKRTCISNCINGLSKSAGKYGWRIVNAN